jgi:hypothetical protein
MDSMFEGGFSFFFSVVILILIADLQSLLNHGFCQIFTKSVG